MGVSASQTLKILGPTRFRVLSLMAVVMGVAVTECAWGGRIPDQGGNLLNEVESVLETIVRVSSYTALAL